MERAVAALRTGSYSEKQAAIVYDVPRRTLRRYLAPNNDGIQEFALKNLVTSWNQEKEQKNSY